MTCICRMLVEETFISHYDAGGRRGEGPGGVRQVMPCGHHFMS